MSNLITKGVGNNLRFKDQLSDQEVWIHKNSMSRYLRNNYGLTSQEYYNLIIYGDKNFIPRCSIEGCDNPVRFLRLLSGYLSVCSNDCNNKLRSININNYYLYRSPEKEIEHNERLSKSARLYHSNLTEERKNELSAIYSKGVKLAYSINPEYKEKISKSSTLMWMNRRNNPEKYKEVCRLHSERLRKTYENPSDARIKSQARRDQTYINKCYPRYTMMYLYIGETDNGLFKFGISHDPDYRVKFLKLRNPRILIKGKLNKISRLEYKLKTKLNL